MPVELLEKIAQLLDPVTLLKFASTDSCVRRAAHQAAVTRLTKLAQNHPDLAVYLSKMSWTKEDASVHSNTGCPCFLFLIGPWRSWNNLKCVVRERAPVLPGSDSSMGLFTLVTRNKIFAISRGVSESTLTAVDRYNAEQRRLEVLARSANRYSSPLQAANFEDTLVVRSCVHGNGYRAGVYTITIYNSATLEKVGEIDLALEDVSSLQRESDTSSCSAWNCSELNLKDEAVRKKLEIGDVVVAKNTIVIHLMFQAEDEFSSETWIWRINTESPVIGDLDLERVFMEPINRYEEEMDLGLLAVNSKYLVRVGQVDDSCILQCFSRCRKSTQSGDKDSSVGIGLQNGAPGMVVLDEEGTKLNVEVDSDKATPAQKCSRC